MAPRMSLPPASTTPKKEKCGRKGAAAGTRAGRAQGREGSRAKALG